jgi:UDP-N-acetylmuramate--alanine ligase
VVTQGERLHFIGIAGSGAAGVALLCQHAGADVDGCDLESSSPYTPPLEATGIRLRTGHDPAHLEGVERVAITPALLSLPHHAELRAAEEAGLPVVPWQRLLGELMTAPGRLGIAVTGTHGKSTTTALLGHLLAVAGMDPTVEVGAYVPAWGASVRPGNGVPFVVEADEFGDNFLHYQPAVAVLTTIEMDHPDFFADRAAVLASYRRFLAGMLPDTRVGGRLLVVGARDPGVEEVLRRIGPWAGRIVRYGPGGEVVADQVSFTERGTTFRLFEHPFEMSLMGEHNVRNATAALLVARTLGAPLDALALGLRTFGGAGRRMELIAEARGVTVFDDYAHHPTEVRAAVAAARQRVGSRRLWAVFEPHMYSRTKLFFDEFSRSFTDADEVVIADIFASRDQDTTITSAEELADNIERASGVPSIATGDVDATARYVAEHLRPGDAVLVMGAGKSYQMPRTIARLIEEGILEARRDAPV